MNKLRNLFYALGLGLAVQSCSIQSCDEPLTVNANVRFTKMGAPYSFPMISVGGITKSAITNQDTLIQCDTLTNVQSLELPLRITANQTKFEIRFYLSPDMPPLTDTLTINHQNSDYFISEECGCLVFHTIESIEYTKRQIDSAAVYNPNITNENLQNIILQLH